MSIEEAATHFGVSKEAIHNRIRRGSLGSVIEDGKKLVEIETNSTNKTQTKKITNISQNDKYYKFLEEQNIQLQEKVQTLEAQTETLRDQKEQMLLDERIKIEEIYKQKDEQLKNILNALSNQFMLHMPAQELQKEEHVEAEIEEPQTTPLSQTISLKKYLKQSGLSPSKQEKIKKRFKKAQNEQRVILVGKKCYLDFNKYNYKDLL